MSAHQDADAPNRNWPHKRSWWVVAAPLLVGTINPAAVHASGHTTAGTEISTRAHNLAGSPARSGATTATRTAPGGPTGHVILTGCIPGLNC